MASTAERFWSKVNKTETCWVWTATQSGQGGYGWFYVGGGSANRITAYAHRWSYEQAVGPVPEGLELDHLCRNRLCVRPNHLEAVTHAENHRRRAGIKHGPYSVGTHCRQGHERSIENTGINNQGARFCRPCARATNARARLKRLAQ